MNALSKVLGLVLLSTLGATLAEARPAPAPTAPRLAINPQPLPPRHDGMAPIAINPQPLPPRGPDPALRTAPVKPYIGETEKN